MHDDADLMSLVEAAPEYSPNPAPAEAPSRQNSDVLAKLKDGTDFKPLLILPSGGETIINCSKTIYAKLTLTGRFFRRGMRVMTAEQSGEEIILNPVRPERLQSIVEPYFSVVALRSGANGGTVFQPTYMKREMAAAILESEARELLPEIRGLSGCPLLLADGRIIGPGFDPATGILVTGGQPPPDVALDEASAKLQELLTDFQFVSPGDHSRALAALITPALRLGGFHRRGPVLVAEAAHAHAAGPIRARHGAAPYAGRGAPSL